MRQRDYFFDNAKFFLIFFVVFGHLLREFISDNETIYAVYKTIYSFHMPAFIFVSGFFAKGIYEKGYITKIAKKLILPYLIFQLVYSVFYFFLYQKNSLTIDPLTPHWSLWFLVSLFFWNIMLLGFSKWKPWIGISISLTIALLIGYVDFVSNYLSLSRTFVFFPMFLIGYHMKKEHIQKLTNIKARSIAFITIATVFFWFLQFPEINYKWLLGSKPYSELESGSYIAMFTRLGFYVLSLIMVFSFLAFVPKGQYFFTKWGKQTLYVYLLHGFFVRTFRESPLKNYFTDIENFIMLAGISLLLTIFLSSQLITSLAQPIIELRTSQLKMLLRNISLYMDSIRGNRNRKSSQSY
ncbi:acyltransferase family protein [Peribacillus tepidiphilus]|uniref:acyltransferase family protein n=1 Tax=Peribacillus tepidiphilus TaxID=2652445 RepID=UPI0012912D7A|nr:acyltransferase family protein [Peribacillus tepidiphilus]